MIARPQDRESSHVTKVDPLSVLDVAQSMALLATGKLRFATRDSLEIAMVYSK